MMYVGIDPGSSSGGIAIIQWNRSVEYLRAMPETERDIWDLIDNVHFGYAVIEKVHSMPGQGVVSTFKFGRNYGFLRGCLVAAEIPFEEVLPSKWQRGLSIPPRAKIESKSQWKDRLKGIAQQMFPSTNITLKTADALLIAEFCRRSHHPEEG
jgi:Holliday junction resolvasome RuvABC endonuclease subunit